MMSPTSAAPQVLSCVTGTVIARVASSWALYWGASDGQKKDITEWTDRRGGPLIERHPLSDIFSVVIKIWPPFRR